MTRHLRDRPEEPAMQQITEPPDGTDITADSTSDTAVGFHHVYKAFVGRGRASEPVLALQDVSFDVRPGEFVSLVGPSGCGKSTCLNLVAGLSAPSEGAVTHNGAPVRGINTAVGYITQDDNLLPWRSLRGNVELGLELRGVPRRERRERAQEFIDLVGLRGFEDHYPHELSGGMRKRAGIIRTLVHDSDVVLMDEPFGPLDAQTRVILQAELIKLWQRSPTPPAPQAPPAAVPRGSRPTVLFVTHDLVEAIALSDRILVFTSHPGTIKRDYSVDLPRPRDPFRIHEMPGFAQLHEALWDDIRSEIGDSEIGAGAA
jgi:NitT/TauT family transport system ATP-binding protein